MSASAKDGRRALRAVKEILDGRNSQSDMGEIMVTAEHAIAALLIVVMGDPRKAARMLNEGLVHGVESRLSLYASKQEKPTP